MLSMRFLIRPPLTCSLIAIRFSQGSKFRPLMGGGVCTSVMGILVDEKGAYIW